MNKNDMQRIIERQLAFGDYEYLINNIKNVNTEEYKKKFNNFYKVRSRSKGWYKKYYDYFDSVKNNKKINFDTIIDYLYDNLPKMKNGNKIVEASFASKMLATINPEMPILDSKVLTNMRLNKEGANPKDRLRKAKIVYAEICRRYTNFYKTSEYKIAENLFNQSFPDYTWVSKAKKVDWFMYGMDTNELTQAKIFKQLL